MRKPHKNKLFLELCRANGLQLTSVAAIEVPDTESEMLKLIADLKRLKTEVRANYFENIETWT